MTDAARARRRASAACVAVLRMRSACAACIVYFASGDRTSAVMRLTGLHW